MANSQILTIALVAIYGATGLSAVRVNITSPPVTNHGQWGKFESCPPGRYAQGFQLKTQSNQFIYDDTALNSIRLFCGDPYDPDTPAITSTIGPFGNWGKIYTCSPGILHGFQLRSEMDLGDGDDTAANNIRFYCSTLPNDHIQGDGLFWGDWTSSQYCHSSQGICGIQTQVEPDLGEGGKLLHNIFLLVSYKSDQSKI